MAEATTYRQLDVSSSALTTIVEYIAESDPRSTFREFNTASESRPSYGRLDILHNCKSAADELNNNVSAHSSFFKADLPCRCIALV